MDSWGLMLLQSIFFSLVLILLHAFYMLVLLSDKLPSQSDMGNTELAYLHILGLPRVKHT